MASNIRSPANRLSLSPATTRTQRNAQGTSLVSPNPPAQRLAVNQQRSTTRIAPSRAQRDAPGTSPSIVRPAPQRLLQIPGNLQSNTSQARQTGATPQPQSRTPQPGTSQSRTPQSRIRTPQSGTSQSKTPQPRTRTSQPRPSSAVTAKTTKRQLNQQTAAPQGGSAPTSKAAQRAVNFRSRTPQPSGRPGSQKPGTSKETRHVRATSAPKPTRLTTPAVSGNFNIAQNVPAIIVTPPVQIDLKKYVNDFVEILSQHINIDQQFIQSITRRDDFGDQVKQVAGIALESFKKSSGISEKLKKLNQSMEKKATYEIVQDFLDNVIEDLGNIKEHILIRISEMSYFEHLDKIQKESGRSETESRNVLEHVTDDLSKKLIDNLIARNVFFQKAVKEASKELKKVFQEEKSKYLVDEQTSRTLNDQLSSLSREQLLEKYFEPNDSLRNKLKISQIEKQRKQEPMTSQSISPQVPPENNIIIAVIEHPSGEVENVELNLPGATPGMQFSALAEHSSGNLEEVNITVVSLGDSVSLHTSIPVVTESQASVQIQQPSTSGQGIRRIIVEDESDLEQQAMVLEDHPKPLVQRPLPQIDDEENLENQEDDLLVNDSESEDSLSQMRVQIPPTVATPVPATAPPISRRFQLEDLINQGDEQLENVEMEFEADPPELQFGDFINNADDELLENIEIEFAEEPPYDQDVSLEVRRRGLAGLQMEDEENLEDIDDDLLVHSSDQDDNEIAPFQRRIQFEDLINQGVEQLDDIEMDFADLPEFQLGDFIINGDDEQLENIEMEFPEEPPHDQDGSLEVRRIQFEDLINQGVEQLDDIEMDFADLPEFQLGDFIIHGDEEQLENIEMEFAEEPPLYQDGSPELRRIRFEDLINQGVEQLDDIEMEFEADPPEFQLGDFIINGDEEQLENIEMEFPEEPPYDQDASLEVRRRGFADLQMEDEENLEDIDDELLVHSSDQDDNEIVQIPRRIQFEDLINQGDEQLEDVEMEFAADPPEFQPGDLIINGDEEQLENIEMEFPEEPSYDQDVSLEVRRRAFAELQMEDEENLEDIDDELLVNSSEQEDYEIAQIPRRIQFQDLINQGDEQLENIEMEFAEEPPEEHFRVERGLPQVPEEEQLENMEMSFHDDLPELNRRFIADLQIDEEENLEDIDDGILINSMEEAEQPRQEEREQHRARLSLHARLRLMRQIAFEDEPNLEDEQVSLQPNPPYQIPVNEQNLFDESPPVLIEDSVIERNLPDIPENEDEAVDDFGEITLVNNSISQRDFNISDEENLSDIIISLVENDEELLNLVDILENIDNNQVEQQPRNQLNENVRVERSSQPTIPQPGTSRAVTSQPRTSHPTTSQPGTSQQNQPSTSRANQPTVAKTPSVQQDLLDVISEAVAHLNTTEFNPEQQAKLSMIARNLERFMR